MYTEGFEYSPLGVRDAHMGVVGDGLGSGKWPYWFTNTPTSRKIKKDDMLIADGSVRLWSGYNSDMARTAIVGNPTVQQREMYQAVIDALNAGTKVTMPGVKAHEIDKTMYTVLSERGFGAYATRVWGGHDIGFGSRTFDIAPFESREIKEGMVLCLEPGIYIPKVGGIRVEDMLVVRDTGAQVLSQCKKKLF